MRSATVHPTLKFAKALTRATFMAVLGGFSALAPAAAAAPGSYVEDPATPDYVWEQTLFGSRKVKRSMLPPGAKIQPPPGQPTPPPRQSAAPSAPRTPIATASSATGAKTTAKPGATATAKPGAGKTTGATANAKTSAAAPRAQPVPSPFRGTAWSFVSSQKKKPALFEFHADGTARYFDGEAEFPGTWAPISGNLAFYRMNENRNFMLFFLLSDDGATLTPFRPAASGAWSRLPQPVSAPPPPALPAAPSTTAFSPASLFSPSAPPQKSAKR